jgi:hypothetical protein
MAGGTGPHHLTTLSGKPIPYSLASLAQLVGPDNMPVESFSQLTVDRILALT